MAIHPPHLNIGDHHVNGLTIQTQQRRFATVGFHADVTRQQQGVDDGFP